MARKTRKRRNHTAKQPKKRVAVSQPGTAAPSRAEPRAHRLKPGPWGTLEAYETYLEAPDQLLKRLALPSQQPVWNFPGHEAKRVEELFEKAELTGGQLAALTDRARWRTVGGNCRIFPDPATVESLSPRSRAVIYRVLGQFEENPAHRYPVNLGQPSGLSAMLESRLSDSMIQQISRLTYHEGNVSLFSDFPLLLRHLSHPRLERELLRVLTRTKTLLVRLKLFPGSDIDGIAAYWSAGGAMMSSLPLMRSLVLSKGVGSLDLAHLLPMTPRGQLYTYPSLSDVLINGRAPDGFWSAVNFFHPTPLAQYIDSPEAREHLAKMYRPVRDGVRFGDLLLISGLEDAAPRHACVFIADDIVYNKDSASFFSPWTLSKLDDVVAYHVRGLQQARITAFRNLKE